MQSRRVLASINAAVSNILDRAFDPFDSYILENDYGAEASFDENIWQPRQSQSAVMTPPVLPTIPSEEDQKRALEALGPIQACLPPDGPWTLGVPDENGNSQDFEIPRVVTALFLDALKHTAAGKGVSIVTAETEVTTQQAATILRVSRPLIVSLVEDGSLPSRKVGNRLRIPLQDLLDYKAENAPKRRASSSSVKPKER